MQEIKFAVKGNHELKIIFTKEINLYEWLYFESRNIEVSITNGFYWTFKKSKI